MTSKLQIGFEFEFGIDLEAKDVSRVLKMVFPGEKLKVKIDGSVTTKKRFSNCEVETGVWDFDKGLSILERFFEWMTLFNVETNKTCGLHFGLSFKNKKLNNELMAEKIFFFTTDDDKYLKLFGRTKNHTCQSICKNRFVAHINRKLSKTHKRSLKYFTTLIKPSMLLREKHTSLNVSKLYWEDKNKYVECRICGGNKYHQRYSDVLKVINWTKKILERSIEK